MFLIDCPYCKESRDQNEFAPAGEAFIARPQNPEALTDEEWADFEKNADVFESSSLKLNKNQSQTEMSNNYGKVGSKCTELGCKGTVMYKSKFCYKHRNLK